MTRQRAEGLSASHGGFAEQRRCCSPSPSKKIVVQRRNVVLQWLIHGWYPAGMATPACRPDEIPQDARCVRARGGGQKSGATGPRPARGKESTVAKLAIGGPMTATERLWPADQVERWPVSR